MIDEGSGLGFVDDAEIPEHEIGDQDLLVERPARVGEFDVAETVDGAFDVNGQPVEAHKSALDEPARGRRVHKLLLGLRVCRCRPAWSRSRMLGRAASRS